MKIKIHIICFLLGICYAVSAIASTENAQIETFSLTKGEMFKDLQYNYKVFTYDSPSSDLYYADFWVMPAKYPDGSQTEFLVYLNDRYLGKLITNEGNWQSSQLDSDAPLEFLEGKNQIKIATLAPEVPMVDFIMVSNNPAAAKISDNSYSEYISEVKSSHLSSDSQLNKPGSQLNQGNEVSLGSSSYLQASNFPMSYTYFALFDLPAGQTIDIVTTSAIRHNIDLFLYSTENSYIDSFSNPYADYGSSILSSQGEIMPTEIVSSGEMQGLNWLAFSEMNPSLNCQKAKLRVKVPRSGTYMVRLRPSLNNSMGLATVNVNDLFEFVDVPIATKKIYYSIPADGKRYVVLAVSDEPDDDSMIFVHGADSDRVVGFNDDAPTEIREEFELSKSDSYICQEYYIPTVAVSVNNFHSNNPRATCTVFADVPEDVIPVIAMNKRNRGADGTNLAVTGNQSPINEDSFDITRNSLGQVIISSTKELSEVEIYSISGQRLFKMPVSGTFVQLETSEMNLPGKGIYIVKARSLNLVKSSKIIIK